MKKNSFSQSLTFQNIFLVLSMFVVFILFPEKILKRREVMVTECYPYVDAFFDNSHVMSHGYIRDFIKSANKSISLLVMNHNFSSIDPFIDNLLQQKKSQQVEIQIATDVQSLQLSANSVRKVGFGTENSYGFLGIVDDSVVLMSSALDIEDNPGVFHFVVRISNCSSIAKEATALHDFFSSGSPHSKFKKEWSPGSTYPAVHKERGRDYFSFLPQVREKLPRRKTIIQRIKEILDENPKEDVVIISNGIYSNSSVDTVDSIFQGRENRFDFHISNSSYWEYRDRYISLGKTINHNFFVRKFISEFTFIGVGRWSVVFPGSLDLLMDPTYTGLGFSISDIIVMSEGVSCALFPIQMSSERGDV